jgi:hypothetical protein
MFMESFYHWMRSPHTPLEEKVTKGLAAMAQWEGTRKIIEWDKRKVDQKDLLARADKIAARLVDIRSRLKPADIAAAQLQAARVLLEDAGLPEELQATRVLVDQPSIPAPEVVLPSPSKEDPPDGGNQRAVEDQPPADPGSAGNGEPGAVQGTPGEAGWQSHNPGKGPDG